MAASSAIFVAFFVVFTAYYANAVHVCENPAASQHIFCDTGLSYEVRANDLVAKMTLEEKAQQLGDKASGVARLGVPAYFWWSEALHGVSSAGPGTKFDDEIPGATSFPLVILTAASFNQTLWNILGKAVSTEARALHNLGRAGLTFWSPNINVIRDPRWGRTMESPGEDPLVVGRYAVQYVRGLQDLEGLDNCTDYSLRPLKVSACCKHFTAYDLDAWLGIDRTHFNAKVTEQDILETFNRPFEMCVREGDVSSVMCSFNNVNGIPACADANLLRGTIRKEWNLNGYIVSDCDSVDVIANAQHWLGDNVAQASAQALKAGLDLDCGTSFPDNLPRAVHQGLVKEEEVDKALKNLYMVQMRLGMFDGIPSLKSLGKPDICTPQNIELATEAAREGIVLLKNDDKTLPLSSNNVGTVAVVGPHANGYGVMIGDYAAPPCRETTPLQGIGKYTKTIYALGCADAYCSNDTYIYPAQQASQQADATVIVVGVGCPLENEGIDRSSLNLPGYQTELVTRIADVAKGPVILVVMTGSAVDLSFAKNNPKVKAILWVGLPGEEGGQAIADVIFGKYNPAGRLPLTFYPNEFTDMVPMTSMQLRPVESLGYPGRTYRFYTGPVVYPFGHGLSYTTFKYLLSKAETSVNIKLNKLQHCRDLEYSSGKPACPAALVADLECNYVFGFNVTVQNVGSMDGDEVILVYKQAPSGILGTAIKELIGFERIFVPAGGRVEVRFEFDACKSLNIINNEGYDLLPSGKHTILLGDSGESLDVDVKLCKQN